jgi:hypothetical protein
MTDGAECVMGHPEARDAWHFTSTMTIPGQPPVQIVCCGTCSRAIAVGDPRRVVAGERSVQLRAAIESPQIEFTKPVQLPEPLSLEQSIDLDSAGHR